ncbi:MAG: flagellar filament capping protein FliD [Lachnospiraceae bacterium]|nr:flagellar filament capping protein FliD [Lachnospiraceae bacterium]
MSIKITGMNSGLDTDAIVRELVSAASTKKESLEKAQTKLEWKQDAWKDLNKKIKSFQATISNLRFSDAFKKKTTSVSNSSLASIVTGDNAVNGSQTLVVKQLAKAGYLTGGQLSKNKSVKGKTTLSDLTKGSATALGKDDKASISLTVKGKTTNIDLTGSSTIDEVVSKLNSAGVTASFDETNQRFFISVGNSGEGGDFQLSANDTNGLKALSGLGLLTKEELDKNAKTNSEFAALYDAANGKLDETAAASHITARADSYAAVMQKSLADADAMQGYIDAIASLKADWEENPTKQSYEDAIAKYTDKDGLNDAKKQLEEDRTAWAEKTEYLNLSDKKNAGEELSEAQQERLDKLTETYGSQTFTKDDLDAEATRLADVQSEITGAENAFKSYDSLQNAIKTQENAIATTAKNAKILNDYYAEANADALQNIAGDSYSEKLANIQTQITEAVANGTDTTELDKMNALLSKMVANEELYTNPDVNAADLSYDASEGLRERAVNTLTTQAQAAHEAVNNADIYLQGASSTAVRVTGQDAVIELNGAEFTSSSNTFSINGLTITAKGLSNVIGTDAEGKPVYEQAQITTQDDVDGIYKMLKNVIKQYNELIKEIDTLYNAASAKGYEPLTSEEKAAMSDDEVEKWEEKIKGALLRHDSELGSVRNIFKEAVSSSFTIGGKKFSLADFGIFTQDYFSAGDNERSMLHIDGDSEDEVSSGNKDLLKKMISSDPDTVSKFFNQFANNLYDKLRGASSTLKGVRSYGNFYSDKTLTSQYDDYKSKIKKQEDKVAKLEDKYYKMFSSMETAMAKINSTSSYISSMFG